MGNLHHPETQTPPIVVVMVPFPAQGHLNQLLHFSRHVAARGVPVHFVSSATHNRQAKQRVHGWNPLSISNLHFHDLPLPLPPSPPPDPRAPIMFPAHLQPTFDAASTHLRRPFSALLSSLSSLSRRVAVVHDPLMSFAAEESAAHANVEAYAFHCISAFTRFSFQLESLDASTKTKIRAPKLPTLSSDGCFTESFLNFVRCQHKMMEFDSGNIYNTCMAIDGEFLDLLAQEPSLGKGKRIWAVGPLNPIAIERVAMQRHGCLDWLDKQPPSSVLYVSFGTMSSLTEEQILELAEGLERSEQRFIWVLREADTGDIFAREEEGEEEERRGERSVLLKDYEKRVEGVGVMLRDWAPQLEILAHRSTGGFLSHCGWNSVVESISMGVPIATWPMHSDQPRNTVLVTEKLKVGVAVREWGRREEVIRAPAIEDAVKRLMTSEEGEQVRRRASQLKADVGRAVASGGSSHAHLQSFISHILR